MKATIRIKMDNAAFDGRPELELARILADSANRLESRGELFDFLLRDANGNTVGELKVTR